MGQQQLLLVILVTIIVGIATVVAINTFSSAAESANVDAVRSDLTQIAASAQAYYMKPEMMGGGGGSTGDGFSTITFNDITFAGTVDGTDPLVATNENGTYTISNRANGTFTVTGAPGQAGGSVSIDIVPDDATMNAYQAGS